MVNLKEIKRNGKKEIIMSVRTTRQVSEWMKEHDVSPTLLFNKAAEELIEEMKKEVVGEEDGK